MSKMKSIVTKLDDIENNNAVYGPREYWVDCPCCGESVDILDERNQYWVDCPCCGESVDILDERNQYYDDALNRVASTCPYCAGGEW